MLLVIFMVVFMLTGFLVIRFYDTYKIVTKIKTIVYNFNNTKRVFKQQLNMTLLCGHNDITQENIYDLQDNIHDFFLKKNGKISCIKRKIIKLWGFNIIPLEIDEINGNILIGGIETNRGILTFSG